MNIRNTLFIAYCRGYYRSGCQSPTSHSRKDSPNQRACRTRLISSRCCMKRSNANAYRPSESDFREQTQDIITRAAGQVKWVSEIEIAISAAAQECWAPYKRRK